MIVLNGILRRTVIEGFAAASFFRGGVGTGAASATWLSLGVSATSFTPTGSTQTVGSILPALSDGSSTDGATVTMAGTGASSFQLTNGGVTPCSYQAKAATGVGNYDLTFQISRGNVSGGAAYPTVALPVTVIGSSPLTVLAPTRLFTNAAASALPANGSTPFFWSYGHPIKSAVLKTSAAQASGVALTYPFVHSGITNDLFAFDLTNPTAIPVGTTVSGTSSTQTTLSGTATGVGSGDIIKFARVPPGYTVSATLGGNAVRTGLASYHIGAEGGLDWIEPMHDLTGASIAAGTNSPLIYTPLPGGVSSGTYNSGTGAVSLTTAVPHGISVGQKFMLYSVASTPQTLRLNDIQTATAGTTGSTLNFTGPTGLGSLTITGGEYDSTTRTAADWIALNRVIRLSNLAMWAVRGISPGGGSYNSGTGATTIVTTQPHTISSGDSFTIYQSDNASHNAAWNATYTASSGTAGTTINFTAATGLTGGVPTSGEVMFALTGTAADQTGSGNWDWVLDGGSTNLVETRGLAKTGLMQQITGAFVNTGATPSIGISSISIITAPAGWNSAIYGFAQVTTSSPHGIPVAAFTVYQSNSGAGNDHAFVHNATNDLVGQGVIVSNSLGALVPQCQVKSVVTGANGFIYFSKGGLTGVNLNDTVVVGTKFQALISGVTPSGFNGWYMEAMATGASTFIVPLASNPGAYSSGGTFQQLHRTLRGTMEVWATQKSDGSLGPIAWKGPFVDNVLLYNTGPGLYTYDLQVIDNGSVVKTMTGNMIAAREDNQFCRLDGQWEWTANDPSPVSGGIWVDQDYAFTRKTMKIPSLKDGLTSTYAGLKGGQVTFLPAAVNTDTGVVTVSSMGSFCPSFNTSNPFPGNAIAFRSTGGLPAPLVADTPYWAVSIDNTGTKFILFATKWDAFRRVSPITLTTQGTGTHTAYACVAPGAAGIYQLGFGQGNTQDDGFYHEIDAGRDVGRTVAFNRLARVSAISMGSFCEGMIDGWSGLAPSTLPQSLTPAGMAAGKIWTGIPASSLPTDVNGGVIPTGEGTVGGGATAAGWYYSDTYHRATPLIGTWLMEGGAYLRDKLIMRGHYMSLWMCNAAGAAPGRNFKFVGTNYYSVSGVLRNTALSKQGGNNLRDKLFAAFVARTMGGPQGGYFHTQVEQEYAAWLAYYTSVADASYQSSGSVQCGADLTAIDASGDFTIPGSITEGALIMSDYGPNMLGNLAYGTLLNSDYHPNLLTLADFSHTLYDTIYTSGSASAYFAAVFYFLMTLKSAGNAGPNKWADPTDMMPVFNQSQSPVRWYLSDGTVQWMAIQHYNVNKAPYGWTFQLNDKDVPLGYDVIQNPGSVSPTPAELTQGQKYYMRQVVNNGDGLSGSYKESTTPDDSGIISSLTPRGGLAIGQLAANGVVTLLSVTSGLYTINDWLWSGNKADGIHVGSQLNAKITGGSGLSWTTNYSGNIWPRGNTTITTSDSTHFTVSGGALWPGMTVTCVNAPSHIPAGTTVLSVDANTGTIATLSQATTLVNGDTVAFYAGIVASCGGAWSPGENSIAAAPTVPVAGVPAYLTNPVGALSYPAQQAAAFAMAAMRGNATATADWNQFNTRNGVWNDFSFARLNLQPSV